jgi:DNA polymerase II small subunit
MSRRVKRDLIELTIEDESGSGEILIAEPKVKRDVESLCLDQYVVAQVQRSKSGSLFVSGIIWPDIPEHRVEGGAHDVYAVFTSDLQVGSTSFMRQNFEKFIQWLNGEGDRVGQASRVRYLLIAGDLIDGVGIYPGQEVNLSIKDTESQYSELAELLEKVPKEIKILIIPGNHDSVRQALPQPPVPKTTASRLYSLENIVSLGNPAQVNICGVNVLMFHGTSLDDVIASVPGVSFEFPTSGAKVLLRARHLAPIYGHRTTIVPAMTDQLVIEQVPDIMHVGHIHTTGTERYRGTLMISSGTWQAQTPYQSKMGIKPDPCVITIVNLKDLSVDMHKFT